MSTQNKKNKRVWTTVVVVLMVAVTLGIYSFVKNQQIQSEKKDSKTSLITNVETAKELGCTRTTQLENNPQYDRALSLLHQKLEGWNPNNDPSENYFPPANLINCIKVIEADVKGTTGAEGLFVINSKDVKQNYFPVTVDKSYSYADDLLNALILIHEITHVQQYIDTTRGKDELSCIDKEVQAFYSSWKLIGILHSEEWKSITLRLDNDDDLHPQLQIVNAIKQTTLDNFEKDRQMCFYGSGKNDANCIDNNRRGEIKKMLLQDDFYKNQCKL